MRNILDLPPYIEELDTIASMHDFSRLENASVMISGATGMLGSFLVDLLMHVGGIHVVALGRSRAKANSRFPYHFDSPFFSFVECDVSHPIPGDINVDFIIHAASTTHPVAYATEPIGTVTSNVLGTMNLLDYGISHGMKRFVFLSSVEVYGENRGDVERFDEEYCGYINSNTLRAGYPESKRLCESLCQAYRKQFGCEIVIPRIARSFGPTMRMSDTKAIAQFIKKGLAGEDIVLKSEGTQLYTYTYTPDAVSGILACMLQGEDGEAYNVAFNGGDITLRDLASEIASICNVDVVFDIPDATERAGYSTATKALLDCSKIETKLRWHNQYSITKGLQRTMDQLRLLSTEKSSDDIA